jgi:ABC-type phosphate/phosphonate transport system substrate-binding protein
VGAVIYDPKVAVIWDVITRYFAAQGCAMDCVFYTNYELQVDALLAGHVDIAWNSPLAWIDAQRKSGATCRALAMRDTDRDRRTHLLVRSDGGIREVAGLSGRTVAVGAIDSPQATRCPSTTWPGRTSRPAATTRCGATTCWSASTAITWAASAEALQELLDGTAGAAAVLDLNWDLWSADGTADPARVRVLSTTAPFDHCNFTVTSLSAERAERWTRVLLAMDYTRPDHREVMDMEGLRPGCPAAPPATRRWTRRPASRASSRALLRDDAAAVSVTTVGSRPAPRAAARAARASPRRDRSGPLHRGGPCRGCARRCGRSWPPAWIS